MFYLILVSSHTKLLNSKQNFVSEDKTKAKLLEAKELQTLILKVATFLTRTATDRAFMRKYSQHEGSYEVELLSF